MNSPLPNRGLAGLVVARALVVIVTMAGGCARERTLEVSELPSELPVPAGARDVNARADRNGVAVTFHVPVPFPAETFLSNIQGMLQKSGWTPLRNDWLNPTLLSSHVRGWTFQYDSTVSPRAGIHQWLGQWQNESGDIVAYVLRYSSPSPEEMHASAAPTTDDLEVIAMRMPKEAALSMQAAAVAAAKGGGSD